MQSYLGSDELYPTECNMLGESISIIYVQNLMVEGDKCEGACYLSERLIKIEEDLKADYERLQRVIKHELMHMKLGISGISQMMDLRMEEAICTLMETE